MEQTAVEWLIEKIQQANPTFKFDALIREAKAMEKEQMIAFGKKCFYKGFEKAKNDDANCFTAWREEANELLTFKSE